MQIIQTRNPHQGIPDLLDKIDRTGVLRDSRNGAVLMFPEPTTIVWGKPTERVVFWKCREANPFFHLFESLWMLAARRDVKFVSQFVQRMGTFSDDGKNFHAAYGYRWRKHFKRDQLSEIIQGLKKNNNCRRQVLDIWDVRSDLSKDGLDLPCNVSATFQINHESALDMVVHNRSNDAMMGAMGANIVHFSILQEFIAAGLGVEIGRYWQVSSNLHVYMNDFERFRPLIMFAPDPHRLTPRCPYTAGSVTTTKVVDIALREWEEDLNIWMKNPTKVGLRSQFFTRVATPMFMAHKEYKKGNIEHAIEIVQSQMLDNGDWKIASLEWLQRRLEKKNGQ